MYCYDYHMLGYKLGSTIGAKLASKVITNLEPIAAHSELSDIDA